MPIVELGNVSVVNPHDRRPNRLSAPAVTYVNVPDSYTFDPDVDLGALRDDFSRSLVEPPDRWGITHRPDDEMLVALLHPGAGAWIHHSDDRPTWVHVEDDQSNLSELVARWYGATLGRPDDVEDTHFTRNGPPGSTMSDGPQMLFTDVGRSNQAWAQGGHRVGATGTSTATTAYSVTDSGASWTTNQWQGMRVVVGSVWGNVVFNTATVAYVDRWSSPATPGGSAGSTPGGTTTYVFVDGAPPAWFVALTTTNISPAHGDFALSGEYTVSGGGFVRKIAPFALTSGVSPMSYTLTPVYTGNGSDTYPSTFYAIGVMSSMTLMAPYAGGTTYSAGNYVTSGGHTYVYINGTPSSGNAPPNATYWIDGGAINPAIMWFETSLNASATVNASGDQLTVTETVTGS